MINHGNRGVPSFRLQISPFSYECPVSCPSTVHEPPQLESHHNDTQSYNVGWTEIFPSFCQSGDLLAHDVHIDKPKAWCQQKRARSHVGFLTEWSPASPVTQLPFVSPLLKLFDRWTCSTSALVVLAVFVVIAPSRGLVAFKIVQVWFFQKGFMREWIL